MHEPIGNLGLLIAPRGAAVRLERPHPLLRALAAANGWRIEETAALRVRLRPLAWGGAGQNVRYGLLPRLSRVRLAVALERSRDFRMGLATYRPGRALNRSLLGFMRAAGPAGFAGPALELEGAGETPARQAARAWAEDAAVAALFLGSAGDTNTAMFRLIRPDGTGAFAKFAAGPAAAEFVSAEARRLEAFRAQPLAAARTPTLIKEAALCGRPLILLADAAGPAARQVRLEGEAVLPLAIELARYRARQGCLRTSALARRIEERLRRAREPRLEAAWRWVGERLGESPLPLGLGHGDFVPWNLLHEGQALVALDWERSAEEMPPGIDLCHFLFQGAHQYGRPPPALEAGAGILGRFFDALALERMLARPLFLCYLVDWILMQSLIDRSPEADIAPHRAALERLSHGEGG